LMTPGVAVTTRRHQSHRFQPSRAPAAGADADATELEEKDRTEAPRKR